MRIAPPDPLVLIPVLPTDPPDFTPGERYTRERYEALNIDPAGFMWKDEKKLAHYVIKVDEKSLAWDESEKGSFKEEYFPPVQMATIEHIPYKERNIPIPPGILKIVIEYIKQRIASGIYEPSNSSYRSR